MHGIAGKASKRFLKAGFKSKRLLKPPDDTIMVEIKAEEEKKVRCLLIGAPAPRKEGEEPAEPKELKGLAKTLGMECAGCIVLSRIEPTPASEPARRRKSQGRQRSLRRTASSLTGR